MTLMVHIFHPLPTHATTLLLPQPLPLLRRVLNLLCLAVKALDSQWGWEDTLVSHLLLKVSSSLTCLPSLLVSCWADIEVHPVMVPAMLVLLTPNIVVLSCLSNQVKNQTKVLF